MTKPRVVFVGWRLGGEFERVIRQGQGRFSYTVMSMDLDEVLRPLVEWRPMPLPRFRSFRLGWAVFFGLGGLRLARMDADLVHTVGPLPVVPNRVDLNTVTFCHAAYDEATSGNPIKGSSSAIGWRLGQRFTLALERWWFRRAVRVLVGISEGSVADLERFYPGVHVAAMPRGIDLRRFSPDEQDGMRFRESQGVERDAVVALFVDQQYRPLKGLDLAIEAFALERGARAATPTCFGWWAPETIHTPRSPRGSGSAIACASSVIRRRSSAATAARTCSCCRPSTRRSAAPPTRRRRAACRSSRRPSTASVSWSERTRRASSAAAIRPILHERSPRSRATGRGELEWATSRGGVRSPSTRDAVAGRILALHESLL